MKTEKLAPMIHVGASKDAIAELRAAIMDILKCQVGEQVKIEALVVLREGTRVTNTTISGCQFESRP